MCGSVLVSASGLPCSDIEGLTAPRRTSRRVTRYRDADMALRWTATGYIEAQKLLRKIQGVGDLWILKAALGRTEKQAHLDEAKMTA